ncbi:MAG: AmmeMemoRadiSam system protein B [Candidatus Micrarchaeaceae archaeon]
MLRKPAFAGSFYPSDRSELSVMIDGFMESADVDSAIAKRAVSYVVPHAGYAYSGKVAAFTYRAISMKEGLEEIDAIVVIGPNHTGLGFPISVSGSDWKTPLGIVRNDRELALGIANQSEYITIDEEAHSLEHSIEVQLPFIQRIIDEPRCCFICMGDQSIGSGKIICDAIQNAPAALGRKIAVIASSDFDHYESAAIAKKKDMKAARFLKRLDPDGFRRSIEKSDDSACGYGPITVSAMFARERGAKAGYLLKYSNSGEASGNYKSVVAYSSMAFA